MSVNNSGDGSGDWRRLPGSRQIFIFRPQPQQKFPFPTTLSLPCFSARQLTKKILGTAQTNSGLAGLLGLDDGLALAVARLVRTEGAGAGLMRSTPRRLLDRALHPRYSLSVSCFPLLIDVSLTRLAVHLSSRIPAWGTIGYDGATATPDRRAVTKRFELLWLGFRQCRPSEFSKGKNG